MKRKLSRYQQLSSWLKKPLGRALLETEKDSLAITWSYVLGDYLLMLGDANQSDLIENAQLKNRMILTPDKQKRSNDFTTIYGQYESLPILIDSIDAILLPHTLEFSEDPYQILRHVSEALKSDGFLIILGFNPWSLWGLRSLFSFGKLAPWSGSFRRASRIKDWLKLLNLELVEQKHAVYRFPFISSRPNHKYHFLERFCKTCLPILGGVYLLVAQKKTFVATPLRSKWKKVTVNIRNGYAEPVRKGILNEKSR